MRIDSTTRITSVELPTPSGAEFETLAALCRAANKQGHSDQLIIQQAVVMHWQLVWAKNFYTGRFVRREMEISRGRRAPYRKDVRRIRTRLHKCDLAGYRRAWLEAPPYLQALIQDEIRLVARATSPAKALMWPHIYRALLIRSLDSLMGKNVLKSKPCLLEKDRCKRSLEFLWCDLTGEDRGAYTYAERGLLKGDMYTFMISVSEAYGLSIVTRHSAHRLRRKQIPDKMALQAR